MDAELDQCFPLFWILCLYVSAQQCDIFEFWIYSVYDPTCPRFIFSSSLVCQLFKADDYGGEMEGLVVVTIHGEIYLYEILGLDLCMA